MSNDLNRWTGIGRLGADPETRHTQSGTAVCNFRIACGEEWKDKQTGEKQERTEWVSLVAWGRLGEICGEYLRKGAQVYVEGKLQTRKWQDRDGNDRYTTEVLLSNMRMLGSRSDNQGAPRQQPQQQASRHAEPPATDYEDDDLPF